MKHLHPIAAAGLLLPAAADPVTLPEPDADRWMYPMNATPGTRGQASTFSALPAAAADDDRYAFFLIRFDTTDAVPAGLDPERYRVRAAMLTATVGQDEGFVYDPTADPLESFGTPDVPAAVEDEDAGRPVELHGAGFRGGFTAGDFSETSPHAGGSGGRNAHPLGFTAGGEPRDISDNVREGFDAVPWAIGESPALTPGERVPMETPFRFEIDTGLPGVAAYLREGLAAGHLWLSLSSLHPATQMGGEFASWLTRDDAVHELLGGLAPTLTLDVELSLPLTLERTAGRSRLEWPEFAGFTHVLEAGPDLSGDSWSELTRRAATADGTGAHLHDTDAGRHFYRIRLTPTP